MSHYARIPSHRDGMDIAMSAQLFDNWPASNEYHISECDTVRFEFKIIVYLVLMNDND